MAAIAETAPRSPQPSAPVVLVEDVQIAEPTPVAELGRIAELATVVPPPEVAPPLPLQEALKPSPVFSLASTVLAPPAPVVVTPTASIENAAPTPVVVAPAAWAERVGAASAMLAIPIEPPQATPRPSRRRWVVGLAIGGVIGGLLVALGVLGIRMRGRAAQDESSTHVAVAAKATGLPPRAAAAPAADSAPASVPDSAAAVPAPNPSPATAQPTGGAGHDVVPWADQPQTSSVACKELAAAAPGSLTVELAIKNAHSSMMRGDAKAAHEAFCSATERGAQTQTVLMGHAHALLIQSDYAAALQVVDRELQLRPSPAARLLRGDVLIRTGNVEEAKQAWLSAAGVPPDSEPLVANLRRGYKTEAQAALRAGDLARADRTLRRVIALGPPDRELCLRLADTLEKRSQSAAAERWRAYAGTLDG